MQAAHALRAAEEREEELRRQASEEKAQAAAQVAAAEAAAAAAWDAHAMAVHAGEQAVAEAVRWGEASLDGARNSHVQAMEEVMLSPHIACCDLPSVRLQRRLLEH